LSNPPSGFLTVVLLLISFSQCEHSKGEDMQRYTLLLVGLLYVSSNAFARVGETPEQIRERFGKGRSISEPFPTLEEASKLREIDGERYEKNGIIIHVAYFNDKSGKRSVGEISYQIPEDIRANQKVTYELLEKLLVLNAGGEKWELVSEDRAMPKRFSRSSAKAWINTRGGILIVTLNEFADYVKTQLEAEKNAAAEKIIEIEGF